MVFKMEGLPCLLVDVSLESVNVYWISDSNVRSSSPIVGLASLLRWALLALASLNSFDGLKFPWLLRFASCIMLGFVFRHLIFINFLFL